MALTGTTMRSARFDFRKPLSPVVVLGSFAAAAALGGLFLIVQTIATASPLLGLGTEARGDTISMWVNHAEILEHDHNAHDDDGHDHGDETGSSAPAGAEAVADLAAQTDSQGFAMPASMMPGTPDDGFQRLQLELDFRNRGAAVATVAPQDFLLVSNTDESWPTLLGGTFHRTDLGAQQVLSTVIAFDVPASVSISDVQLVWTGDGDEVRFAVDAEGGHSHG